MRRTNDGDGQTPPVVMRPALTEHEQLLAALDYIEAHDLLSEEEESGSAPVRDLENIRKRAQDAGLPLDERKRALLILAHHRSEAAFVEIMRYLERPALELVAFAWCALDEASSTYLAARMARASAAPRAPRHCAH